MSGNSDTTAPDSTGPLVQFWTDWLNQSNEHARALWGVMQPFGDPQQVQRRWLDTLSQSLDQFMRSPAFLEALQRNMKGTTELKALQDQLVQGCAQQIGMPTASDISGLFERLNSIEREIRGRLDVIETRLKSIESAVS